MNAASIIAIIILLAFIGEGYRIGLVMTLFAIIKTILGTIIAAVVCSSLAGVIPQYLSRILPVTFISVIVTVLGILRAVAHLFNLVDKIPVARQVNRMAGLAAGLLHGIIIIWIALVVLAYFCDTSWGVTVYKMVHDSDILRFMDEVNPIRAWGMVMPMTPYNEC